ncbi:MAG: hypothetical protein IJQ10_03390 [Clostridia bacterium]|nr:hypothetical protein [Clostridia bacterium]
MKPIKINKRYIVLASIIVSLGAAVGINYWLSPDKALKNNINIMPNEPAESSVLASSTNIEDKNSKDIEKIKSFFENEREQKEKYKKQIAEVAGDDKEYREKIIQEIHQESKIETLIKSKMDDNLIDCLAKIGKDGCNIIVSFKTDLTKENVYKIKDIVKNETKFNNEEIKIIEKKI